MRSRWPVVAVALIATLGMRALVWAGESGSESTGQGTPAPAGSPSPAPSEPASAARAREVREKIVGRWQMVGQGDVIEFRADGTFSGSSEHAQLSGKYQITPEGDLSIAWGLPLKPYKKPAEKEGNGQATETGPFEIRRTVRFEQEELVLTDPATGDSFRYRRLP